MEAQEIKTGFRYNHQPYICKLKDKIYLFFCYCEAPIKARYGESEYSYMPWKIAHGEWIGKGEITNIARYDTGLSSRDVMCSPYFYERNNEILSSFIGGRFDAEDTCVYNLYTASGSDLSNMSKPEIVSKESVFTGFQNQKYQLRNWQETECEIEDLETKITQTFYAGEFDAIKRIIGVPTSANLALITGIKNEANKTLLYDLRYLKAIAEILVDQKPIYKSCLWDNFVVYAKQIGEFEERQLYYSENFQTWTLKP